MVQCPRLQLGAAATDSLTCMASIFALAATLSAALVSAQGRGGTADTPEDNAINCAKYCLNAYNDPSRTGCNGQEDYGCVCRNNDFLSSLDACFISACNSTQFSTINEYIHVFCDQQGVQLDIDVAANVTVDLSGFPALSRIQCAVDCVQEIFAWSGCDASSNKPDFGCFCGSNGFLDGFGSCIYNSCEFGDFRAISDGAQAICAAANKPVTVTVTQAQSSLPVTATPAARNGGGNAPAGTTSAGGARATPNSGSRTAGNGTVSGGNGSPTSTSTQPNGAPRMAVAVGGIFAAAIAFAAALL
ncbi:hypothetical protein Dda_0106 [Drechslerella dactyloides]|uniref:CFEM domain-containing protein n=1 Tax=Drechslerella dactyloides TaxID=74499 RepID=A0AAD6J3R7_DREDA|nr:hypothetical protein Dda_0106 [Drechslerella dactyloides]